MHKLFNWRLSLLLLLSLLTGCSRTAVTPAATDPALPPAWARGGAPGPATPDWLGAFDNPVVARLVGEAIINNYSLRQERARVQQARHAVIVSGADRLPSLDLTLDGSRRGSGIDGGQRLTTDDYSTGVAGHWEIDLWGKLDRAQQAAHLRLAAQQARLTAAERNLAAETARGVFDVMAARQLLDVARQRLANAEESREIVAGGYRQGLNDALDLYLARNQEEREKSNVAQQEQTYLETVSNLQLALARYPDGRLEIDGTLPRVTEPVATGLPSDLLTRRADLQQAWLDLLAADAELAVAHKNRFPSLALVGSAGMSSAELRNLLDTGTSVWSLTGDLTQPLFNAGRLKALEEQAAARVREAEQVYLDRLFSAFADVENALSRARSLSARHAALLDAEHNARAALELALEQYRRGLVSYTTVLESQRQAFDARVTVVQLKNQMLQNRIALYLALGGEFTTE